MNKETKKAFKKTKFHYKMLQRGIDLLYEFLTDYQFDPEDGEYCGFLNVGYGFTGTNRSTWTYICNNPEIFKPIINKMLGKLEGDRLDVEETIFRRLEFIDD